MTIKGVKLISNNNTSLNKNFNNSNKFSTVSVKLIESPRKINDMGAILDDYDKTKIFNKELIKNMGSPKGPIFARAQAKRALG